LGKKFSTCFNDRSRGARTKKDTEKLFLNTLHWA
jgi:hypothetical protein